MKPHLTALLALVSASLFAAATNEVTLVWSNPADNGVPANVRVYSATNMAGPFLVLTNIAGTNSQWTIKMEKQATFFFVTRVNATNDAWESDPSNVALAPWPKEPNGLSVRKGQ